MSSFQGPYIDIIFRAVLRIFKAQVKNTFNISHTVNHTRTKLIFII